DDEEVHVLGIRHGLVLSVRHVRVFAPRHGRTPAGGSPKLPSPPRKNNSGSAARTSSSAVTRHIAIVWSPASCSATRSASIRARTPCTAGAPLAARDQAM